MGHITEEINKYTSQQGGQTRDKYFAQQCSDMLRSNAAIVWPELANAAGPTMLRYRLCGNVAIVCPGRGLYDNRC